MSVLGGAAGGAETKGLGAGGTAQRTICTSYAPQKAVFTVTFSGDVCHLLFWIAFIQFGRTFRAV